MTSEGRRLVGPLAVLMIVATALACEHVVATYLFLPFYRFGPRSTLSGRFVLEALEGATCLCAGILIDRFGLARIVGLALIGWSVLIMASGVVTDPLGLRLLDLLAVSVFGAIALAPVVAIKHVIAPRRTAFAYAMVSVALYAALAAKPQLKHFIMANRPLDGDLAETRQWAALVCLILAAFITMVWLVFFRNRDGPAGPTADAASVLSSFLANRSVWRLVGLSALGSAVFWIGYHRAPIFVDRERDVGAASAGPAIYLPYVIAAASAAGAAIWSDGLLAKTRSLVRARRPFVIGGFLFTVALALLPLVRTGDLGAMSCIVAFGLGLQILVGVVVLDIAPARGVGTLFGLFEMTDAMMRFSIGEISIWIYQPWRSYVPLMVLGGLLSLAGMVLAARALRRLTPLEDPLGDRRDDLPSIFA